jgi:hypothetical protein
MAFRNAGFVTNNYTQQDNEIDYIGIKGNEMYNMIN